MRLFLSLLPAAALLAACTAPSKAPMGIVPEPNLGPSKQKIEDASRYAQEGLPFTVEINPLGAIFDGPSRGGELQHLKEHFLLPLAKSRYAAKIQRVRINAGHLEWYQWTCVIELKEFLSPISITHFAGLYDGRTNQDPDGYIKSRQYVLAALENIGRLVGWSAE